MQTVKDLVTKLREIERIIYEYSSISAEVIIKEPHLKCGFATYAGRHVSDIQKIAQEATDNLQDDIKRMILVETQRIISESLGEY